MQSPNSRIVNHDNKNQSYQWTCVNINVNLCWLNGQVFDLAPYDYPVGPSLQQQTSKQQAASTSAVLYMIWLTRRNAANTWIIDLTRNNTAVMGRKQGLPIGKTSHHNHGKLNALLVIRGHTYVWSGLGILKIPNVGESLLITCWSSLKCLPSLTRTLIIVSSEKCRLHKFFKRNE